MTKLKERQFYLVGDRKTITVPEKNISLVQWKNGTYALKADCNEKYNCDCYKIIKQTDKVINKMDKKYGN